MFLCPSFIATIMGLLSLATTTWSALDPTQTTETQPITSLTAAQAESFVKLLILAIQYAGNAYPEPDFKGKQVPLFDSGCNNSNITIGSWRVLHSETAIATCSFYETTDCSPSPYWPWYSALTTEGTVGKDAHPVEIQSYKCELVRPRANEHGLQG